MAIGVLTLYSRPCGDPIFLEHAIQNATLHGIGSDQEDVGDGMEGWGVDMRWISLQAADEHSSDAGPGGYHMKQESLASAGGGGSNRLVPVKGPGESPVHDRSVDVERQFITTRLRFADCESEAVILPDFQQPHPLERKEPRKLREGSPEDAFRAFVPIEIGLEVIAGGKHVENSQIVAVFLLQVSNTLFQIGETVGYDFGRIHGLLSPRIV